MAGHMMKVFCVLVVCIVVSSPYGKAIPSHQCPDVMNKIKPCDNVLRDWGRIANYTVACCDAFYDLSKSTTFNHQTTCYCLTQAARNKDINPRHALLLPDSCRGEVRLCWNALTQFHNLRPQHLKS
ncbi:non-specific lipid-transfer protein-like protein [Tanacetum coccineum]